MPRPIILGVVGDSAAGKTTITRGLVRILGEEHVTAISTDDYHRYDRQQRAERQITPLHPDCNYLDIMAQHLAPPAPRRADSQARVPSMTTAPSGPRSTSIPSASRSIEGLLGYHTAEMREMLRRARLPGATRGAAPQVEGSARLLAAGLHNRPGARRARPARGRLGGVHPPPGALRRHGGLLPASRRGRRPRCTSTRS